MSHCPLAAIYFYALRMHAVLNLDGGRGRNNPGPPAPPGPPSITRENSKWPVHALGRLDMEAEDDHCTAVHVARGCIRERLFSTKLDPTHEVRNGPRGRGREVTLLSNESTPQSRKEAYRYW